MIPNPSSRINKPINRSPWRLRLGSEYYRIQRWLSWQLSAQSFALQQSNEPLRYTIAEHCTPLRRELSNVEQWLQDNKVINLKIAAAKLQGIIVKPGETFSYWRLIGKPTRAKGYKEGMILKQGTVTSGTGGGLCQLSNLIYWMTLHSPLTVTERYRHSYDVFPDAGRSQPFGSGATCFYNYIDLQIENRTSDTFQLMLSFSDTHLFGQWRSEGEARYRYEVYEKRHWFTQEYWGGYIRHNEIFRKIVDLEGSPLTDELVTENHAIMMYEPCLPEGLGNWD
jgi:vancomycin resistance protein VanW